MCSKPPGQQQHQLISGARVSLLSPEETLFISSACLQIRFCEVVVGGGGEVEVPQGVQTGCNKVLCVPPGARRHPELTHREPKTEPLQQDLWGWPKPCAFICDKNQLLSGGGWGRAGNWGNWIEFKEGGWEHVPGQGLAKALLFSLTQATCSLPDAPGVHSGLTWRNDAVNTRPPKAIGLQEIRVLEDADFGGDWKCGFDLFGGGGGGRNQAVPSTGCKIAHI